MGNTPQTLPLGQGIDPRQVYAYFYGQAPIDPTAATINPAMTVNQAPLTQGTPTPAAAPQSQAQQQAPTATTNAGAQPSDGAVRGQIAGAVLGQNQPTSQGAISSGMQQGMANAPKSPDIPKLPDVAAEPPPPAPMLQGPSADVYNRFYEGGPSPVSALPRNELWDKEDATYGVGGHAKTPLPPSPPIPLSRPQKIMRDIAIAMNPIAAPMLIEGVLNTQRAYQQRLQEFNRNQPAVQEQADIAGVQHAGEISEAFARAQEAQAAAGAETVHTGLEQIQFEQGQRMHVSDVLQQLAGAFQQGTLPPARVLGMGQMLYQNDPILQARMKPEEWNSQLQAIARGQPTQASMQVAKVGDVPASISWMGQSWNAKNIGQAPVQVQLRWEAENAAHGQQIAEEKAKEQRQFQFDMAKQIQSNHLELDRMSTMFGFKNAQEAQGRYYKAQQDINDADAQFAQVQQLAQNPNSANDHLLLMKAAGGSLPEGTKRLNVQEIDNIKQLGGLDQRAMAELGKWEVGQVFTSETRAQLLGALKTVHDMNVAKANADVNAAHQLFQSAIQGVPGAQGANGAVKTQAAPPNGQVSVMDPQGGIHYFADQKSAETFKQLAGIK